MGNPVLTAIIIHRAQPVAAVATGEALMAQGVPLRLLVVDNGSPAADIATLRAGLPAAEVIEMDGNSGFGPAANAGLRRWLADGGAEDDWALVCPHDAIAEPGCIERLMAATAERPRAGLASAEYGDVGHYGYEGKRVKPSVHRWLGPILIPSDRRAGWEDADHPHGTMMILRRGCVEDIGLFNERYFAYCEEADIGLRAQRAGWEVGVVWGAVVRNTAMTSEQGVPEYLMMRNSLLLVRQHFGPADAAVLLAVYVVLTVQGSLFPNRRSLYWHTRGRWLAMLDFTRGRFGPPPPPLTLAGGRPRPATSQAPR